MSTQNPDLINDSVLANSIYDLLLKAECPLPTGEIAKNVLDIKNLPPKLANEMVKIIIGGDSRFISINNKTWQLAPAKTGSKKIRDSDFTVLDVEIIGYARAPHIIEIAAYRIQDLEITEEYCTFINPGRAIIPKIIMQLSGQIGQIITTETLQTAPFFKEILPKFFHFIGNSILVAHNAHFDLRMINKELKRLGHQKLVNRTIDTLRISREFIKGTDTQKLSNLAYFFGIPGTEFHVAREDAKILAKIFIKLVDIFEENNIFKIDQLKPFFIDP